MRVVIQLTPTSQPLEYNAINTWETDNFYCIYTVDGIVYKFPIIKMFRAIEEYGLHGKNILEKKEFWFGDRKDQND